MRGEMRNLMLYIVRSVVQYRGGKGFARRNGKL